MPANEKMIRVFRFTIILLLFSSCENKFEDSSFKKRITISRYLPTDLEKLSVLELDSSGLFYYTNIKLKNNVNDSSIYNFLKNINTQKVKSWNICMDTVKKFLGGEYLYQIKIKEDDSTKTFDIDELYNTGCSNKMMDSIRSFFIKLKD